MAGKTAAEVAAQDPRLKAMLMELGSARFDEFPMEDGEGGKHGRDTHVRTHSPKLTDGAHGVIPKIPIRNAWAKAMQRGDFDDDDAAKVAGMDSIADGQLARSRRNQAGAATALKYTNGKYESNLRRDRNGYVPPHVTNGATRGTFSKRQGSGPIRENNLRRTREGYVNPVTIGATRGTFGKRQVPGPIHVGDGPIDIGSILSGAGTDHRPRPTRDPSNHMSMFGRGAFAGGPSSQPLNRPQPATRKPEEGQNPLSTQTTTHSKARVILPDGAAAVLQLPCTLSVPAFPKKCEKYQGTSYLVRGTQPSEDVVILVVEDTNLPEIRHAISQFDTYMSVSSIGLMLKFDDLNDGFKFYGVEFEKASNLSSFVQKLGELLERQKQPSRSKEPISSVNDAKKAPAATADSEAAAPVGNMAEPLTPEQEERKDRIARRWAELRAKKQAEITSASRQPMDPPKHIDVAPCTGKADEEGTSGSREQASSANLAIESLSAASIAPKSNPEETLPTSPLKSHAGLKITLPTERKPVQAVNDSVSNGTALADLSFEAIKHEQSEPVQAAGASAEQTVGPSGLHPDLINEMIEWAWDTFSYMRHTVPDQCDFDRTRTIIGAACAAVIGRASPSFRKLSPDEKRKFIADHAQPQVEHGFLNKLGRNEPVAEELEIADAGHNETSQPRPKDQPNAGLQTEAPSKLSGPVYEIQALIRMRSMAATIDHAILCNIPRLCSKTGIPQPKSGPARVSIEAQVQQAAEVNSNWLKKERMAQEVDSKVEALADFLSPAAGQTTRSPSAGLSDSIHNRSGTQSQLTGALGHKTTYQKDLEDLVTKSADKGNAFDHQVVKATEGISRLSLK